MAEKLSLVDMIGIGNLLEPLVAEDIITCEERDRIILRIAKDNEIDEYRLSVLAGYKRSKAEVLARMEQRKQSKSQPQKQDDSYISLTELARNHSKNTPGYVIQSWLRSENTLAFLKKKKTASFTLTPKLWIEKTEAIGIASKQGKGGGTFAHPMIGCEFASWISPEFKMLLLKLSLDRERLKE